MRVLISCLATAMLLCAVPAIAQTSAAETGSNWDMYYENDVATGPFLGRLHEVLTSEQYLGGNDVASFIGEYLDAVGVFNMDLVQCRSQVSGNDIRYQYYESYEDTGDTQLIGKFLKIPDAELRSADYVNMDDALLYFGFTGLVDQAALELEWFKQNTDLMTQHPMLAKEGVGEEEFQQAFAMIEMMQIEEILRSTLNGELAMVLYDLPSVEQFVAGDVGPADFDGAVMVGIDDAEYVTTMLDSFGKEVGLMKAEMGEHNEWSYYKLMMDDAVGILFNDEILIASPNVKALLEHMHVENLGFDAPATQFYFDLNVERLHEEVIHPALQTVVGMASEEHDVIVPHEAVFYLFDVPESDALGHFTLHGYNDNGEGYGMEINAKTAILNYELAYLATGLCVFAQVADFDFDDLDMVFGSANIEQPADKEGCDGACTGESAKCAGCPDAGACDGCQNLSIKGPAA